MILINLIRAAAVQKPCELPSPKGEAEWLHLANAGMLAQYLQLNGSKEKLKSQGINDISLQLFALRGIARQQRELVLSLQDEFSAVGCRLGLLKGIAFAHQIYALPECRPMADIDLLVEEKHESAVRAILYARGFEDYLSPHTTPEVSDHHGAPLHHPVSGLWIELHTALFPSAHAHSQQAQFKTEALVWQNFEIEGRGFLVLEPHLNFAYVAAHWSQGIQPLGKFHGLMDLLLLQKQPGFELVRAKERIVGAAMARSVLVPLAVLKSCGVDCELSRADWREFMHQAQWGPLRLAMLVRMTRQIVLGEQGFFTLLGRHVVAQWWEVIMQSRSGPGAMLSLLRVLISPPNYGGLRGWRLQKHRVVALFGRIFAS